MIRRALSASLATIFVAATAFALELPGSPQGPISDFAGVLSLEAKTRLDTQLRAYEEGTRQIAVAIFAGLDGGSVEDISIKLAEKWKIGGKGSNDGVLLTLFLSDRKLRIEVGYGLEDRLTDAMCARIIREVIAPPMQKGDLESALRGGIAAIDTVVTGRPHPESEVLRRPAGNRGRAGRGTVGWPTLIFLAIILLVMITRRGGRGGFGGGGMWIGGGGGWSSGGGGWSSGGGGSSWGGGGGGFGGGGSSGDW